MMNLTRYTPTTVQIHSKSMREAPRPSVLDVLTTGVTIKHDVNVILDKQTRNSILGAVGILAGAAFLAVMIARRR